MTRTELYDRITPCGTINYLTMVYLLQNVTYTNPSIGYLLVQRLSNTGSLSQQDWLLFARSVVFVPGSPITAATVESWLTGKCNLTGTELREFLEFVKFTDGSTPTFILSQNGDFIIAE